MNEAFNNIMTRRSVKSYKPEMPPQELIDAVIEAGTYAPTGMNRQSPIIIAVTDKAVRDRLSKLNADIMGGSGDPFYGAPAVLIVLADRSAPTYMYDGSLVMANLLLAANAVGLGSCWIHRAKEEFQTDEGKALLRELGITGDYEGIGHCILGYPAGEIPAAKPRKENWVYRV
ncbi:MAG: nitroreductase [Oscillospiraceae bacterium]